MERSQILETMSGLKLFGMKAAYDEIIATAVKRQHEPQQIGSDLLAAEIALLDGMERTADATAMGPTPLLVLDRRDFIPFLERNPEIAVRLIEVLCERVRRTSEMVESVAFLEHSARLAKLLLRLAENYGEETKDGVRINLKMSQQELDNLIASSRESVNRQLNAWAEEGIIKVERDRSRSSTRTRSRI